MFDSLLQFTLTTLASLIAATQPLLPVICFVLAWAITGMLALNLFSFVRQGAASVQKMHRIPCANCRYATHDYRLKCSVHPLDAFSEEAISCLDFGPE